jgi:hypothetical protein
VKSIGQNAGALHLLKSLFLPTLYTVTHGDDGLVENAVRQNVKGSQIQPLTSLQWVHMTLLSAAGGQYDTEALSHQNQEARKQQGKAWIQRFEKLISRFHSQVEKEGVDACSAAPGLKRPRKNRQKAAAKRGHLVFAFLHFLLGGIKTFSL